MRFGVSVATNIGNASLAVHAEDAGFDTFWATDSQMIWSDVYSYLTLAASLTKRITIGPLVAVAPTRLAPVTAQSIGTVNCLAPGRTVLAIGTAHTAMRTMGMKPMTVAAFSEYLRVVRALLHDEEVEYELNGARHWIRFMQRDLDMVRLEPPVPVYVSGLGPRTQRLAGKFGDGLIGGDLLGHREEVMSNVAAGAAESGQAVPRNFMYLQMAPLAVVLPGERFDSDIVVDAVGPTILGQYHSAWHDYVLDPAGFVPPRSLQDGWEEYLAIVAARRVPQDRQYIDIHEGHGTVVRDDERSLLTERFIRSTAVVGGPEEVIERVRRIASSGVSEFILRLGYNNARETMARFSRYVMDKV